MSKEASGYIFELPPYSLIEPRIPQVEMSSNEKAVLTSLTRYTNLLNTSGEIDALVMTHKKDPEESGHHFVVSKPTRNIPDKHGHAFLEFHDGYFACDGDYSFALGMYVPNQTNPFWGAVTSFNIHNSDLDGPLINQLQFRRANSVKNAPSKKAFNTFNEDYQWEFALVNLVSLWTERAGMKSLYIQPGSANKYFDVIGEKRAKKRYDQTATALGFDPDPPSKAYKLLFSPFK